MRDKLSPPFKIHHNDDAYWLEDAAGVRFCYCYFRDRPIVGTGADKPSGDIARRFTALVARLPEGPPLADDEREALSRFIAEERPGSSAYDALRALAREQLIAMGLLKLGRANRGKAAGR